MAYNSYVLPFIGLLICLAIVKKITTKLNARSFSRAHGCMPAKRIPQKERIFGYDYFKESLIAANNQALLETGEKRYEKYGMTWKATVMGRELINTIDPENIKTVLATSFGDFGLGHRIGTFGPLLGHGIFTTDGAHWEHSRALVRPNFSKAQIGDLSMFEHHVSELIGRIPRDKSTVDLQPLFFGLTLDSATEFLFGESIRSLLAPEGSEQQKFAASFDFAQAQIAYMPRLGPMARFIPNKPFKEACDLVHDFVDRYVHRALSESKSMNEKQDDEKTSGRYVFLTELAKSTSNPQQLRDEVLNVLLAGRDTTASLLSNTFFVLSKRPDIWARLKAEVDELNGEPPSYESLRGMKYVKYILNESLRLYPVVPTNSRTANKSTTLPRGGGPDGDAPIYVAPDQRIVWSVYALHRRRDIYGEDADQFRPERWEGNLRAGWGYLPFNGGARICVGQQFALTEASYTMVRLVQKFGDIESRDSEPWKEQFGLTTASLNGTKVALVPR